MERYLTTSIEKVTNFQYAYVIGDSMAPLLKEGDLLFLKKKI